MSSGYERTGHIRSSNCLRTRGIKRGGESMHAGIGSAKRVSGGQDRLAIAASERDSATIPAGSVAEGVLGGNCEAMTSTGNGRGRIPADDQLAGGGRVDRDAALASFDATGRRVGGRYRLAAIGLQGSAEGMH